MKTILVDAVDTFITEQGGEFKVFEPMHELLESFPNKKIILTGAPEDKWQEYGLDHAPYEFFTLSHNPEKTDPKYFEIFLAQYGLSVDDVIYFEHNPEAVKVAESVGIKSYRYDHTKADLDSLNEFITKNI